MTNKPTTEQIDKPCLELNQLPTVRTNVEFKRRVWRIRNMYLAWARGKKPMESAFDEYLKELLHD